MKRPIFSTRFIYYLSIWDSISEEQKKNLLWQSTLIFCIIYKLLLDIMHKYMHKEIKLGKKKGRSPREYTFMILNVPQDLPLLKEKEYLDEVLNRVYQNAKIVRFTFAYNILEHTEMYREYLESKSELEKITIYRNNVSKSIVKPNINVEKIFPYLCCSCLYCM